MRRLKLNCPSLSNELVQIAQEHYLRTSVVSRRSVCAANVHR